MFVSICVRSIVLSKILAKVQRSNARSLGLAYLCVHLEAVQVGEKNVFWINYLFLHVLVFTPLDYGLQ